MFDPRWMPRPVWAAEDETGGDVIDPPADAAPPADAPPPADAAPAPEETAEAPKWWQDKRFTDQQRRKLEVKGWTVDDPQEALQKVLASQMAAEAHVGGDPEKFLKPPTDPAKYSEWARANAKSLGLPDTADKYTLDGVEVPKGISRDADLEKAFQTIAFEEGMSPAAFRKVASAYAAHMGGLGQKIDDDLSAANGKLEAELRADWGQQYAAKTDQARKASQAIMAEAGLDDAAQFAVLQSMKDKAGDAGIIRLFAAIGGMMGEDAIVRGSGGASLGSTPAEARAELARQQSPGGEYYQAVQAKNRQEMDRLQPRIDQLRKITTQA